MNVETKSVEGREPGGRIAGLCAGAAVEGSLREARTGLEGRGELLATARSVALPGSRSLDTESGLVRWTDEATPVPVGARARIAGGSGEVVLLVDDETMVLQMAGMALRAHGYEVIEAENGEAALALWPKEGGRVRLLLTDMRMPGITGPELARRLQAQKPELLVIYSSGYCDAGLMRDMQLAEGVNFVEKPYTIAALAGVVRRALAD